MASEKNAAIPGVNEDGDIDWPLTFPLRKPIEALGETYNALTLQEPTAQQAIKYRLLTNGLSDETVMPLLSEMTAAPGEKAGIPEASINKMAASDLIRLTRVLSTFFDQAAR